MPGRKERSALDAGSRGRSALNMLGRVERKALNAGLCVAQSIKSRAVWGVKHKKPGRVERKA